MIFPTRRITISSTEPPPVALTVAGSDSGSGAGIQADLKAMASEGVHGTTAITALTAQNSRGVEGIEPVPPEFVAQQIEAVTSDFSVEATKTGMLFGKNIIEAVVSRRNELNQLVVDPVMVAESGDPLMEPEAEETLAKKLVPASDLVTPNWPEARRLLELYGGESIDDPAQTAIDLASMVDGPAVLVKGGHVDKSEAIDWLARPDGTTQEFSAQRIDANNTHGAGCAYSSLITARLARGENITTAIMTSKQSVSSSLRDGYACGQGPGTLDFLCD